MAHEPESMFDWRLTPNICNDTIVIDNEGIYKKEMQAEMAENILLEETKGLPDEYLQMVLNYIRFLQLELKKTDHYKAGKVLYRIPGGLDESFVLPDDFDETPDSFKGYL